MKAILKDIEEQALRLPPKDRAELIRRLIVSLADNPEDSSAAVGQAWNEELARRLADMDMGKTVWIPAEDVFARLDALIKNAR